MILEILLYQIIGFGYTEQENKLKETIATTMNWNGEG